MEVARVLDAGLEHGGRKSALDIGKPVGRKPGLGSAFRRMLRKKR